MSSGRETPTALLMNLGGPEENELEIGEEVNVEIPVNEEKPKLGEEVEVPIEAVGVSKNKANNASSNNDLEIGEEVEVPIQAVGVSNNKANNASSNNDLEIGEEVDVEVPVVQQTNTSKYPIPTNAEMRNAAGIGFLGPTQPVKNTIENSSESPIQTAIKTITNAIGTLIPGVTTADESDEESVSESAEEESVQDSESNEDEDINGEEDEDMDSENGMNEEESESESESDFVSASPLAVAVPAAYVAAVSSIQPAFNMTRADEIAGLYPDTEDPNFIRKLVQRTEFAETLSKPLGDEDPCGGGIDFEITPVQQFVGTFLHPSTPYHGMLLYHGVGVGKTCAAIVTAEGYLEQFPYKKVIIVAPPNIQPGFYRTIFDITRVVLGRGDDVNTVTGCTGNTYLTLTNNLFTRDLEKIQRDVTRLIRKRYAFYGYRQFANHIRSIASKVPDAVNKPELVAKAIRREFNYRLLIIDEAHNLRDVDGAAVEDDIDTSEVDLEDSKSGKLLTPQLQLLLKETEGLKLALMTATPMFNDVREIVFLLNLLLRNDKRQELRMEQILDTKGNIIVLDKSGKVMSEEDQIRRPQDKDNTKGGRAILGPIASAYVSFMRGENPNSFPVRLKPALSAKLSTTTYPRFQLSKFGKLIAVPKSEITGLVELPIVPSPVGGLSEEILSNLTEIQTEGGLGYTVLDSLLQAGNFVFPIPDGDTSTPQAYVGKNGFDATFAKAGSGGRVSTISKDASWLLLENLETYSPKGYAILKSLETCEGVAFIYSRFVRSGAYAIALALEANGYTAWGRDTGYLVDGNQNPNGRQCALCSSKERNHGTKSHVFTPAKFILLTGEADLSPKNAEAIAAERNDSNVDGGQIKVVIGSQIAAEGLDLKFVREIHVLDSWFHLNKIEQIVGRGIRFCSHSLIKDKRKRNTTVFLHAVTTPNKNQETADLYSYRLAYKKALQVGKVSRILKEFAVDCNLRRPATVLTFDNEREIIDSQNNPDNNGAPRLQNISDMPYTSICDWLPDCNYTCEPEVDIVGDLLNTDTSTYTQFSAKFRESILKREIQSLFKMNTSYKVGEFEKILGQRTGAPLPAIEMVLRSIVGNRFFRIQNGTLTGYVIIRNNNFIFQPESFRDVNLPAAVRIADFPIKKDTFTPTVKRVVVEQVKAVEEVAEAMAELGTGPQEVVVEKQPLWNVLRKWIEDLVDEKVRKETTDVELAIEKATEDASKDKIKKWRDKLAIIVYFVTLPVSKSILKTVLLEFIWDNFLTQNEQRLSLMNTNDEVMKKIGNETFLQSGSVTAFRFVNLNTGQLDILCSDGTSCSKAVVDTFLSDPDDPLKKIKMDTSHSGNPYGFLAVKRGATIIFKTAVPNAPGEEIPIGLGCENVTNKTEKVESLVVLGTILDAAKLHNLNLQKARLQQLEELKNGTRFCTLLELVLRTMDAMKVNNKKWFYRLVAAKYAGQKYKISKVAALGPSIPNSVSVASSSVAAPKHKTTKKKLVLPKLPSE